jgi:hypothetical protein
LKANLHYGHSVGVRTKNVQKLASKLKNNTSMPITEEADLASLQRIFNELRRSQYSHTQAEDLLRQDPTIIDECYTAFESEATFVPQFTQAKAKAFVAWMKSKQTDILNQPTN